MGGVHFAVEQLKKASAAVTRRAWLAVVMDAVCGGPADPADDADAAEVCLVTRALFLYIFLYDYVLLLVPKRNSTMHFCISIQAPPSYC